MADRDLVLRLTVENEQLKAKLAESEASFEKFKAANAGVATGAAAATAALTEEGSAAQTLAAGLQSATSATQGESAASEALAAAIATAQAAVSELATAAQLGGSEMQAAAVRASAAYDELGAVLATTASTAVVSPAQLAQIEALNAQLSAIPGVEQELATSAASASAAVGGLGKASGLTAGQVQALSEGAGLSAKQLASLGEQTGLTAAQSAALRGSSTSLAEALGEEGAAAQVAATGVTEAGQAAAGAAQYETALTSSLRENANAHVQAYEAAVAAAGGEEAYTAATNAATAAAAARASSENAVVASLRETRVMFAAAAAAVETGSAGMVQSVTAASTALGNLLVETKAVQAAGGIVTPAQQVQIDAYILELRALAGQAGITAISLEAEAVATEAVGTAAVGATGKTNLFRAATAQAGQALVGKTASLGALTAGFLRFLGPIGLAIAAVTLLPTLVKTLSDAFKQLASLIGIGVSKAVAEMVEGFEKAQEGIEGLDTASRAYTDSADLLIASGIDTAKAFKTMADSGAVAADVLVQMGEGFGQSVAPGADQASAAVNRLYEQINAIRVVDPAFARELSAELISLARSSDEGTISSEKLAAGIESLREKAKSAAPAAEDLGTAIKEKFGDRAEAVRAQLGGFSASVDSIRTQMAAMQEAGFTSGQSFDVLKSSIANVIAVADKFPAIIAKYLPHLLPVIEGFRELAKGADPAAVAIKKVAEATLESVNSFNTINAALDEGTEKLGSRAAALAVLVPAIEKAIDAIEKQRASNGSLSKENQKLLDGLIKLQKESGGVATEAGKLSAAFDDQAKKVSGVVKELKELDKAYREDAAEIEKHRAKSVTAAHEAADAARQSAVDQLNALNERNRNAEISNAAYLAEYTRILDEERAARQAALDDERRVNEEARVDLAKVAEKRKEQSQKIQDASAEELRIAQDAYADQVRAANAVIEKIKEIGEAPGKAAAAFVAGADTIEAALDRIRAMAVKVDIATTSAFQTSEGGGGGPPSPTNPVGGGEGVQ